MASKVRVGRVAASTSTGTQDLTIAGLGSAGDIKGGIFYLIGASVDNTSTNNGKLSIGFTDGTRSSVISNTAQNNVNNTNHYNRDDDGACVYLRDTAGAVEADAHFDSFITDGIRIDWDTAPGVGYYLVYVLYAGSNTTCYVDTFNLPGGGALSVESPTFEPDQVLMTGSFPGSTPADADYLSIQYGWADNGVSVVQGCQSIEGLDNQANVSIYGSVVEDLVLADLRGFQSGWFSLVEITSFDSLGFNLTQSGSTGTSPCHFFAVKFDDTVEHGLIFPPFDDDEIVDGVFSIGNFGFTPQFVHVHPTRFLDANEGIVRNTVEPGCVAIGWMDEDHEYSMAFSYQAGSDPAVAKSMAASAAMICPTDTGLITGAWSATFIDFDASGANLSVSSSDTSHRWMMAVGIGESSDAGDLEVDLSAVNLSIDSLELGIDRDDADVNLDAIEIRLDTQPLISELSNVANLGAVDLNLSLQDIAFDLDNNLDSIELPVSLQDISIDFDIPLGSIDLPLEVTGVGSNVGLDDDLGIHPWILTLFPTMQDTITWEGVNILSNLVDMVDQPPNKDQSQIYYESFNKLGDDRWMKTIFRVKSFDSIAAVDLFFIAGYGHYGTSQSTWATDGTVNGTNMPQPVKFGVDDLLDFNARARDVIAHGSALADNIRIIFSNEEGDYVTGQVEYLNNTGPNTPSRTRYPIGENLTGTEQNKIDVLQRSLDERIGGTHEHFRSTYYYRAFPQKTGFQGRFGGDPIGWWDWADQVGTTLGNQATDFLVKQNYRRLNAPNNFIEEDGSIWNTREAKFQSMLLFESAWIGNTGWFSNGDHTRDWADQGQRWISYRWHHVAINDLTTAFKRTADPILWLRVRWEAQITMHLCHTTTNWSRGHVNGSPRSRGRTMQALVAAYWAMAGSPYQQQVRDHIDLLIEGQYTEGHIQTDLMGPIASNEIGNIYYSPWMHGIYHLGIQFAKTIPDLTQTQIDQLNEIEAKLINFNLICWNFEGGFWATYYRANKDGTEYAGQGTGSIGLSYWGITPIQQLKTRYYGQRSPSERIIIDAVYQQYITERDDNLDSDEWDPQHTWLLADSLVVDLEAVDLTMEHHPRVGIDTANLIINHPPISMPLLSNLEGQLDVQIPPVGPPTVTIDLAPIKMGTLTPGMTGIYITEVDVDAVKLPIISEEVTADLTFSQPPVDIHFSAVELPLYTPAIVLPETLVDLEHIHIPFETLDVTADLVEDMGIVDLPIEGSPQRTEVEVFIGPAQLPLEESEVVSDLIPALAPIHMPLEVIPPTLFITGNIIIPLGHVEIPIGHRGLDLDADIELDDLEIGLDVSPIQTDLDINLDSVSIPLIHIDTDLYGSNVADLGPVDLGVTVFNEQSDLDINLGVIDINIEPHAIFYPTDIDVGIANLQIIVQNDLFPPPDPFLGLGDGPQSDAARVTINVSEPVSPDRIYIRRSPFKPPYREKKDGRITERDFDK